jgi:hypothetical protein
MTAPLYHLPSDAELVTERLLAKIDAGPAELMALDPQALHIVLHTRLQFAQLMLLLALRLEAGNNSNRKEVE